MLKKRTIAASPITMMLVLAAVAVAQDFDLDWWTVDAGGDMVFCTGAEYELSGTIGQPDVGAAMTGGGFELTGGFWAIATVQFCPGDIDGDGDTDQSDLGILLASWGIDAGGDLDCDDDTDQSDLGILLADWGCGT